MKTKSSLSQKKTFIKSPVFRILGLLIILMGLLFTVTSIHKKDIQQNGFDNTATVNSCELISFIDNAKSQNRISYYSIRFDYNFNGFNYSKTIEMDINEFNKKFDHKIRPNDLIKIGHSYINPKNVMIIRSYD